MTHTSPSKKPKANAKATPAKPSPVVPLLARDPWLSPYREQLEARLAALAALRARLLAPGQSLADFASAHEYFGLHLRGEEWILREWAPHASRILLVGDFNGWQEQGEFELTRLAGQNGEWELRLPARALAHGQHYKLRMCWQEGGTEKRAERIPAYARRVVQDAVTKLFSAQVWQPAEPYRWRNTFKVSKQRAPRVYEAHVGMAQEQGKVGSYVEFREQILPRIAKAGYNTLQLMAVQEHPYYGSFGYQVSNFFAPSSRFGTPEELCELIDAAHELGLAVVMDLVHSHAVKNEIEGLSRFDGSYDLYFHAGPRGEHSAWSTRCFDYGKIQVLHFLLSNCRYWLDAFHFDGFRFDGVTSMLYHDHGLGQAFDHYGRYFDGNVDLDALLYLGLAAEVSHSVRPDAVLIAEDMSAMPALAAAPSDGGFGFDYRLAMGIPDFWIRSLRTLSDQQWNVAHLWHELTSHRPEERTISYAESHDQALVGDKTLIFWLADKEMYEHMQIDNPHLIVARAIALHKMIRLVTFALAGHGYLNFMGNEFGHPEWIDFPRPGNDWSYHYARRQWSLRDNPKLKYYALAEFDQAMMQLAERYQPLERDYPKKVYEHVERQLLVVERAGLLFAFNFNPTQSFTDLSVPAAAGAYTIVLDSDAARFCGHARIDTQLEYPARADAEGQSCLRVYLPARSALVFAPKDQAR
jgi:1,4-alpha-glucan branching enzyme